MDKVEQVAEKGGPWLTVEESLQATGGLPFTQEDRGRATQWLDENCHLARHWTLPKILAAYASHVTAEKDAEIERLRAEIERLQKLVEPEWFYPGEEHDGENCYFSEREAVQEVLEWDARPGDVVVIEIARATSLPPVWACAKKLADHNWPTEGEWFTFTVHESEEEAEAQKAVLEGEKADG